MKALDYLSYKERLRAGNELYSFNVHILMYNKENPTICNICITEVLGYGLYS